MKHTFFLNLTQQLYKIEKIGFISILSTCYIDKKYTVPKNNLNLRKQKPGLSQKEQIHTVQRDMFGLETRQILQPGQARFLCEDSDYFWNSV